MATHSSVLAWRIPGTGKPGGLPSMGSHRVGHDWSDLAAAAARCFLTSYFCIPVPYNEKGIFGGVWVLKGLVDLHRTIQLQLLSITGQGIDLGYSDIEWFALETNRDHSVIFEIASKYCISDFFVDYDGYSISSKESLATVVDIMVTCVKFNHSSPF